MGTSSARRGPTTALWRAAKGAATRYLSPEGGGALDAREVVARYLTALEETPGQGDSLAVFRSTRKIGQELGALWEEVKYRGWERVLQGRSLSPLTLGDAELLAQGLSNILAGSGGGLEEAVIRTALGQVLRQAIKSEGKAEPAHLVRLFLATALSLRLSLDLGEPLEAAARNYGRLKDGLRHIQELIEGNGMGTDGRSELPATPDHWRGLKGWAWITTMMAGLLKNLEIKKRPWTSI